MVGLDLGRRSAPQGGAGQQSGYARIGHVKELELRTGRLVGGRLHVLTYAQEQALAHRVQVGRVALELERSRHAWRGRCAQVERVQRIDLPERHDVPGIAHEAHRVDLLAGPQPRHLPHGYERPAAVR